MNNGNPGRRGLAVLFCGLFSLTALAEQAVFYVNPETGNDANDGRTAGQALRTLTKALALAPGNSTIQAAAGIYGTNTGERFPLQFAASNVTLLGAGRDKTIIRQNGDGRVFCASNLTEIAIRSLTVTNGRAHAAHAINNEIRGGGLWFMRCEATLDDVAVAQCSLGGCGKLLGGGLAAQGGRLTLNNCAFLDNSAYPCQGSRDSWAHGGAVACDDTALTISNCVFSGNYAYGQVDAGFLTWCYSSGGALFLRGGSARISGCEFTNNSSRGWQASSGGAIAAQNVNPLEVEASRFENNYVCGRVSGGFNRWFGAALHVLNGGTTTLARCALRHNAGGRGGISEAISHDGKTLTLSDCVLTHNAGYGINQKAGDLSVTNCLIVDCADGIFVAGGAAAIVNCTLADCAGWGVYRPFRAAGAVAVRDSIAWGNAKGGISPTATVSRTCSQEPHPGAGNLTDDPLLGPGYRPGAKGATDLGYRPARAEEWKKYADLAAPRNPADERRRAAEEMGRTLAGLLDLARPELAEIAKLAQAETFAEIPAAFRDGFVKKIRLRNLGDLSHQGHATSPLAYGTADYAVGKLSEADYKKCAPGVPEKAFLDDVFGMAGAPGTIDNIDWLAGDQSLFQRHEMSQWYPLHYGLTARYWESGDPIYLRKYFEIFGDFWANQKRLTDARYLLFSDKERNDFAQWPLVWGYYSMGQSLFTASRVEFMIKEVAGLGKLVSPGARKRPWSELGRPWPEPATRTEIELIPPLDLAHFAVSMVKDHAEPLVRQYVRDTGVLANQRLGGLSALGLIASVFDDFKLSAEYRRMISPAFSNWVSASIHQDGGFLEQSFNYNFGNLQSLIESASQFQTNEFAAVAQLKAAGESGRRCLAALVMPGGGWPVVGNQSYVSAGKGPALERAGSDWKIAGLAAERTFEDQLNCYWWEQGKIKPTPPAFASVYFPYAGYAALRSGWERDALYLFFLNARQALGHRGMGYNGIQVEAYGRRLLVCAGSSIYGPQFMDATQQVESAGLMQFFDEKSSFKQNTVLAGGQNQNQNDRIKAAPANPLDNRWHVSANFDLIEGKFADGYGSQGNITHLRRVYFVKKPGLWVLCDRMEKKDGAEREFTQIWNFPPAATGCIRTGYAVSDGFTGEQVVGDASNRVICTLAPTGANVALHHFGGFPLNYEKFYGSKNPYRGWYGAAMSGIKHPAVNIHARWKAQETNSTLLTLIAPSRGRENPVKEKRDLSGANGAGFEVQLPDGARLNYRCAAAPARWELEGLLAVVAEDLLTVRGADGVLRGIVLGCRQFGGDEVQARDFEFELGKGKPGAIIPIQVPPGFRWRETGAGATPDYQ